MTTRDAFLAKIRAAQPAARPRPEVPLFDTPPGERLGALYARRWRAMGGTVVEATSLDDVRALIRGTFRRRCGGCVGGSGVSKVTGRSSPDTSPVSMQDVDVGIVRGRFGVAETGSVWFSEDEYIVNSIGYLVQHLVVLLDPARLSTDCRMCIGETTSSRRAMRCS